MQISFFSKVADVVAKVGYFKSFEAFARSHLLHHNERVEKDGALCSMALFKANRTKSETLCLQGAVLDFDNAVEDTPSTVIPADLECAWHTTHSATDENPKWRLYIPFNAPVPPNNYPHVVAYIQDLLKYPEGIDRTCFEISRAYYLPSCEINAYRASGYQIGKSLDVAHIISEPVKILPTLDSHAAGRNDRLKQIASAMFYRGEKIDTVIDELMRIDAEHQKPLFTDAMEGYRGNARAGAMRFAANIYGSVDGTIKPAPEIRISFTPPAPTEIYKSAPGIVGDIASYINQQSLYEQPELALAASLAFVSAIRGHRIANATNLRTNLTTIGLAGSGWGKDHALGAVAQLMAEADCMEMLAGKPKSDSAVVKCAKLGPRLFLLDEIGLSFASMAKAGEGHEKKILQVLMELFSAAGRVYAGGEYATVGMERVVINQPHVCIYGTSTPERFWGAFTTDHAVDGFLPRLLIFSSTAKPRIKTPTTPITTGIVNSLKQILKVRIPGSELLNPKPHVCGDGSEVQVLAEYWDALRRDAEPEFEAIYARGMEHTIKVALTLGNLERETLEYAKKLTTILLESTALEIKERVASSKSHENQQRILRSIKRHGEATLTQLYKWHPAMSRSDRTEAIESLVGAGLVDKFQRANLKGAPAIVFQLVSQ